MVQSHIMNVLPRRLLATLWASQETRISLSNLMVGSSPLNKNVSKHNQHPVATAPSFLCSELPIRYTHILRLLSTLHEDVLQTPLIRHVAQRYLVDICTLVHPSLLQISPRAFSHKIHKLRQRQSQSLILLRYALASSTATSHSVMLMEHINAITLSIHLLLDQHDAWTNNTGNQLQVLCPLEIAHQAVTDARKTCSDVFGDGNIVPDVLIKKGQQSNHEFAHIPNILHRILYESTLLCLSTQCTQGLKLHAETTSGWLKRHYQHFFRLAQPTPLHLDVFDGPTSIGYRLTSKIALSRHHFQHDIPRNPVGLPACPSILRQSTHQQDDEQELEQSEWFMWSGWRAAKTMAGYFGGHLDVVSLDGLGSTMYLGLDRDNRLLEHYPSSLFQHRSSSRLFLQRASSELDAFLCAVDDPNNNSVNYISPATHHHAVSLTAAVGHA